MSDKLSYLSLFEKYISYSEAFLQYNRLNEQDRKIIEPYIRRLKEAWQNDLKALSVKNHVPEKARIL